MLNVIRSEFYKTRHRAYFYIFLSLCCMLSLGVVLLFFFNSDKENPIHYEVIVRLPLSVLSAGVYFSLLPNDIVFSEEYKHQTMKNSLSFGISRESLYFGKLVSSIVLLIFSAALTVGVFLGGSYLFLGVGDAAEAGEITRRMLLSLTGALPLWIGALSVLNMMSFQFKNSTMLSFAFVGVFALLSTMATLLGYFVSPIFYTVRDFMIMPQFDVMQSARAITGQILGKCYLIGLGYAVVSSVIGVLLFRRREVK